MTFLMSFCIIFLGKPLSLCESGTWVARVGGLLYEHRVAGVGEGSHGSYARVEGSLYDQHPSFSAGPSAANRTQLAQGLKSYNYFFLLNLEFMVTVEVVAKA